MADTYKGAKVYTGEKFLFITGLYSSDDSLVPDYSLGITCDFSGNSEYLPVLYDPLTDKYYSTTELQIGLLLDEIDITTGKFYNFLSVQDYNIHFNELKNICGLGKIPLQNVTVENLNKIPYFTCNINVDGIDAVFTFDEANNYENLGSLVLDNSLVTLRKTNANQFEFDFEDGLSFDQSLFTNTITLYGSESLAIPKSINTDLLPFVSIVDSEYKYATSSTAVSITGVNVKLSFSGMSLLKGKSYYIYIPYGLLLDENSSPISETIISFSINNEQTPGDDPGDLPTPGDDPGEQPTPVEEGDEIVYVDPPTGYSYGNGISFDGLLKYYKNNSATNSATRIKRFNNIILLKQNEINKVVLFPVLRTRVRINGGNPTFIKYYNELKPITVTITLKLYRESGTDIKIYNIEYDEAYELPINDEAKCIEMKVEFNLELTHLERSIKFYKLSSTLFNKIANSNNSVLNSIVNSYSTSEYDSIIDLISGTPVVNKWGCLLLTNTYDVIETTEVEHNNEVVLKGIAELVPTTKVRMGNLSGIYNETFGKNLPKGYGLYGESVYLTGNFYLNNGKSLIDIDKDITVAVGNINRIQDTINNLNNTLFDSIYNLTLAQASNYSNLSENINQSAAEAAVALENAKAALTASFNEAIASNSEAIFKLGKDYSLWAVGNAGISIINPNISYNEEDGSIDDSTVGDGDEYLLLQGENVQIATNKTENGNIKVVCTTVNPAEFKYSNDNLFNPKDDNDDNVIFKIGWITPAALSRVTKHKVEIPSGDKLFRYVALNKADGTGDGHQWGNRTFYTNPPLQDTCNVYSFTSYLTLDSLDSIYIKSNGEAVNGNTALSGYYYIIPDVVIAGMFENGKFNASLIEVENIIAVGGGTKNPNFNVNNTINSENNYPTTNTTNPFVVISGTTGKITAQGMLMKEATIGDIDHEHIKITDNNSINVTPDYNVNSQAQKPAIYFRNGSDIITEISSKKDNLLKFFERNPQPITIDYSDVTYYLGNDPIQYNRNLTIANSDKEGFYKNNTIIQDNNDVYFKYNPDDGTIISNNNNYKILNNGILSNIESGTYEYYNGHWSYTAPNSPTVGCGDIYILNKSEYNTFIPTRTSARYWDGNNFIQTGLVNSDIGKISYSKVGDTVTSFSQEFSEELNFDAGKIYEISGSCSASLPNLSLISSTYRYADDDNLITSGTTINGLRPFAEGIFKITLTIGLYEGNTLKHTLKTIRYLEQVSKTTKAENCSIKKYSDENNVYDVDSTESVIKNIPYLVKNSYNQFSESIRFSKLISEDTNKTYKLKLVSEVEFSQESIMSDFKYYNSLSQGSHLPDIIDPEYEIYDAALPGGSSNYSEATPKDNGYNWEPLLCPTSYTINPKITVTNVYLKSTIANQRTIILGNGFLTGFDEDNHFSVSFLESNNTVKFRKSEFVLGIGSVLSNNGSFNAFKLDSEYTINKLIPILCGTLYPSLRLKLHSVENDLYTYYNFSGYSLLSNTDANDIDIGGPNKDTYITTNLFKDVFSYRPSLKIIYGTMYYIKSYDLYICTKLESGRVTVMFGNIWNKLFSRYGTNIVVQITPKYYELVTTLGEGFRNLTYVYNNPVFVNNSAVYKNKTFSYKSATDLNNGETIIYGESITKTSLLGLEFDCWVIKDGNYSLDSKPAIFDITINYIPNLS